MTTSMRTPEGGRAPFLPACPCCGCLLYPATEPGDDPDTDVQCRVCFTRFAREDVWGYWRVRREVAACEEWAGWPRRLAGIVSDVRFLARMHGLKLPAVTS
jgi:hypothetical protein